MPNRYKLLVVEDEANIRSFMEAILSTNGYQVLTAQNGAQAKLQIRSHHPDAVILDLGLPDMDGLSLIGFIREQGSAPIIVLSARTNESDKVAALDLGANDYVTKPFGTAELLARVRAVLRGSSSIVAEGASLKRVFRSRDLTVDFNEREVYAQDEKVELTQTEFNIVAFLCEHAGRMMTYNAIIHAVWGEPDAGSVKKLQVNMANIRRKLGSKPGESKYIANELGIGYRMINGNE